MGSSPSQPFPDLSQLTELRTITDWIRFAASTMERYTCFYGHGFADPYSEARFLVLRSLLLDWDVPESCFQAALLETERAHLYERIRQRTVERVPSAYLLQEAWFCHEPFYVTSDVLIPRSPIAELIEARFEPWLSSAPQRLLDLCTGSGCIGIAMARVFPEALVDLSDLSDSAVHIATSNVAQKDLEYQVNAYQGDLFDGLPQTRYDLIVSNPPYVDAEDIDDMPAEFSHEPRLGLAAGGDGLDIVRRILSQAPDFLTEDGWLVCEVGNSAMALIEAYPDVPFEWPEFSQGGHGVFIISQRDLIQHQSAFKAG
ncbi:50S ribosomal protein L3 N(5)-glutamine methyltransferase [Reinekea blandensis]|uniref:Modification methylase, HemK family protein n=1 Tax=Reinekea blandensis MED297 TaxID=314283 RepID=A4BEJ8_9GAMM|nr:50S ribosomal protein L3 N(5)-glutamine methyltransferase [Reinekea blandensis]EAR09425.1 modification methylase, HemK family protein [Reinekea sp. MED297] [Reinekea blandensis MED297]